jgi:hypothetical protein
MTFEDFKKDFEKFSKVDTAEKYIVCENLYQKHLLYIEDANYFEPIDNDLGDDISNQYEQNLNRIFNFDFIVENQIYVLVKPSFHPEHLLVLEKLQNKFVLTLTTLTKSYWSAFYADNKIQDMGKNVLTSELNNLIGDKLFKLLDKVFIEARQPIAGGFVLDGVVYGMSKLSNGEQKRISKHSPSITSKSGKVIEIIQLLIDNIQKLDNVVQMNIETKITAIQD